MPDADDKLTPADPREVVTALSLDRSLGGSHFRPAQDSPARGFLPLGPPSRACISLC
jgi:hypothetical protein